MAFSTETIGRLYASGRNYINSAVGLLTGIGLMSAAQNKGLMDALNEMYNGVSQIVHGATSAWTILAVLLAPIVTPILSRMASNSAKVDNQAKAVAVAVSDPNNSVSTEAKISIVNAAATLPEVEKVVAPPLAKIPDTVPAVVAK